MTETFHPFSYQEPMNLWGKTHDTFGFFISCGMGKTVVTLKVIEERILDGSRGALIIAPVRVCSITWPDQIRRWSHSSWMRIAHLRTPEGMRAWHNDDAEIYLINPEQLPNRLPEMFPRGFTPPVDLLVIDEISTAKSHSSVRYKALRQHIHHFKQRIGLTGSPIPNDYLDLFAQIRLLDDGERLGKSFSRYKQIYFNPVGYMGYKSELKEGAKKEIDAKIADLCLVMLGDDYLDVPTCATEDVAVTLPPDAKAAYKKLEKELLLELEKSDVVALTAATLCTKLLQLTGGSVYGEDKIVNHVHTGKIDALKKIRKAHGKEPILVLTAFKHESARILRELPGSRMFDEKDMDAWKKGEIQTWVADPRSLSFGIDGLQVGGRIAVWFTLTYSNETYLQTNARLVRTGQSYNTIIYRLVCPGTLDDAVCEALRVKSDTQTGLFTALKALQEMKNKSFKSEI